MGKYKTVQINGKQVREHRYIMSVHLGRELLESEIVHHIDCDKANNSIENLEILSRGDHLKKHNEVGDESLKTRYKEISKDVISDLRKTKTIQEIANILNVSTMTIWYRMKKYGIDTTGRKLTSFQVGIVRKMISVGTKQKHIALKFNVSEQLISDIKKGRRYAKIK